MQNIFKSFPNAMVKIFFLVFCFEIIDFHSTGIQKAVACVVVKTQNKTFFFDLVMLPEYVTFAVTILSTNQYGRPSPRTRIYYQYELMNYFPHHI